MAGTAFQKVSSTLSGKSYDVPVIGGGMAAIMTAIRLQEAGLKTILVADRINSPALAGSQIVRGVEGAFEEGGNQSAELDSILRNGQQWMEDTIEKNGIDCRFSRGYEIKGISEEQLATRAKNNVAKNIYRDGEIVDNTNSQTIQLPGYTNSVRMECAGQVNVPEMLEGMLEHYQKLGGEVALGVKYTDHSFSEQFGAQIDTTAGTFHANNKPVIATGARHMAGMEDFPVKSDLFYTMAMTFGPLSDEDAQKYSSGPIAFCNVTPDQNMLWGSIDSKKMLTLGFGDTTNPDDRAKIEQELLAEAEGFFPGLTEKYKPEALFGEMMCAANYMPVVGETSRSYVVTGWGGRGMVPAAAAAGAIEKAIGGDRAELKVFEDLQPGAFDRKAPAFVPQPATESRPGQP
jgi:glycine/D-amino acid oxidase-like deaminating enzyme